MLLVATSLGQMQKSEEIAGGRKEHEGRLSVVETVRL